MIRRVVFPLIVLFPGAFVAAEDPIDLARARGYFDDARSISERDGGELWGTSLYGPMLFVDPASRFTVANQADTGGYLEPSEIDGLFVGTLPESEGIANTKARWAGVEWTMLIWPLPEDDGARRQLLAHEMFHRIQDDLKLGLGMTDNKHLDSREGRLWMRLEWRALSKALTSADEDRAQAIEDALVFRRTRQANYPVRISDELMLELNEGLAEYTGIRIGRSNERERIDQAVSSLARYDHHPNFVRSFAYASGPAYGLLLDAVDPNWRAGLNAKSDLGRLLAKAYRVRVPTESDELVAARMERYDGPLVVVEEDERHQGYLAQQAEFKARFTDGPTLILPLSSFPSFTFDPNGVKAYGDKGSVYLTTRMVAEWGILEVTSGGALLVRKGQDFVRVVVPAPNDAEADTISGDGYSLRLNEGWKSVRIGDKGNCILRNR